MLSPGATMSGLVRPSRVGPRLEKKSRKIPSEWLALAGSTEYSATEPTVMAFAAAPGDTTVSGMSPELPAATTTTLFFSETALFTAWLIESVPSEALSLPRLIEMTSTEARFAHQ